MTNNTTAPALTDEQRIRASMTGEQIRLERKLTCEAIEGAIGFGQQGTNPPPSEDHWLAPFWKIGQQLALLTSPRAAVLPDVIEAIASQWDECMFAGIGHDIDIGASIRDAYRRLDAAPAAPVAEPVRMASIRDFGPVPMGEGQDATSTIQQALDCPLRDWPVPEIRAQAVAADGAATPSERAVIDMLIALARATFLALDDSEEVVGADGPQHIIDSRNFDAVSDALDALNELPDDKPGYTLDAGGKAKWALRNLHARVSPTTSDKHKLAKVAFEAHFSVDIAQRRAESAGGYADPWLQAAWRGFRAGFAAVSPATAEPDEVRAHVKWLHSCLRDAGYCIDGGKCHHECGSKGDCFRQAGCVPLTGSHLSDDWTLPVASEPATAEPTDYAAIEREHFGDPDKRTGIYAPATAAERAAFEAWVTERTSLPATRDVDGFYVDAIVYDWWKVWQARASQAAAPQENAADERAAQKYDPCDPGNWRDGNDAVGDYQAARAQAAAPRSAEADDTLRCPFCGTDDFHIDSALGKRQALCNSCEAAGPTEETDADALASFTRMLTSQAAAPADAREPSPTAGMNLGERIKHVGGRENAAGYIEFGSVAAVGALIKQVIRDLPRSAPADAGEAVGVADSMPGTSGFTMACFEAAKVPIGTKLYAAAQGGKGGEA
ncbi:hypothetical protein [Burkholderia glumae]|uniref:hypothetical protein n=1 Tax=Burkholderia glumae TaxID=337 RepID=UPI002151557D|nr:hypothetical protein [Burkholderia glumae]